MASRIRFSSGVAAKAQKALVISLQLIHGSHAIFFLPLTQNDDTVPHPVNTWNTLVVLCIAQDPML